MASGNSPFRADIEGLRGIAILLVVLYHAAVPGLSGGFVGVDVFFVLSGFFITGLLVRELDESGEIQVGEFYARRALRLLPALLFVLVATMIVVMALYAPIDRANIAETARAVALSSGNVHFANQKVNYFSSRENTLLHTWSLGVEEQFYLIWPLLLLFITLLAERRQRVSVAEGWIFPSWQLVFGMGLMGALSFATSQWLMSESPSWAFFGLPARLWEFALGGALFVLMRERSGPSARAAVVLQLAGVLALGIAVASYDRGTPYPGVAALLPAFAALALLLGGSGTSENRLGRALGSRPLRWLGRLSFAWYLWHWPLIGLGRVINPEIDVVGKVAWSVAALALAWFTQRYVEEGARTGKLSRLPASRFAVIALVASVSTAILAHLSMLAAERRVEAPDQRPFAAAREDRMKHDCWATTVDEPRGRCEFGSKSAKATIALLGDSHAEHWLGALDRAGRVHGWKVVAMVKGGCPVADMPEVVRDRRAEHWHECARYREAMLQRIIKLKPTAVILSSWDHYVPVNGKRDPWQVSPEEWYRGLRKTYSRLAASGINTIAIRGTPRTWFDVPACLSRRSANLPFASDCTYERARALSAEMARAQTEAARGLPVRFIDMNDQICPTARCSTTRNGTIVFTDDNHLTASFSRTLAPVLASRVAPLLTASRNEK